jgi:hypothetical protein
VQDALDDVVVAGAAAEVALHADPDLLLGGRRVLGEQVDGLHDHARCAEAALKAVALPERLLHGVEITVGVGVGQALDRRHVAAIGLDRQHVAALHAAAVEVDRAGPAVRGVAPDDGAGLAQPLA